MLKSVLVDGFFETFGHRIGVAFGGIFDVVGFGFDRVGFSIGDFAGIFHRVSFVFHGFGLLFSGLLFWALGPVGVLDAGCKGALIYISSFTDYWHSVVGVVDNFDLAEFPHVKRWFDANNARPAVQKALTVLAENQRGSTPITDEEREIMFGNAQYQRR